MPLLRLSGIPVLAALLCPSGSSHRSEGAVVRRPITPARPSHSVTQSPMPASRSRQVTCPGIHQSRTSAIMHSMSCKSCHRTLKLHTCSQDDMFAPRFRQLVETRERQTHRHCCVKTVLSSSPATTGLRPTHTVHPTPRVGCPWGTRKWPRSKCPTW
jgi:hypothetical protein